MSHCVGRPLDFVLISCLDPSMSNPPIRPPALPSSSYQPKVQIQSSTHPPSKDAASSFYATGSGAASTESNPLPAMRSRAGSVNTVSSLRTGTQGGSISRLAGDAPTSDPPSNTPSRSRSGTTASHAGGIQPPAAFFRTAPSTPSKHATHRNMPFAPAKYSQSRSPTKPAVAMSRRGFMQDSRHGTDPSDIEPTSRSSGEHDRAPFIPISLLGTPHSDSPAVAARGTSPVYDDLSFSTGQAADASYGTTGPGPLSYRSKASREPLLPTLGSQPLALRGAKPRGSIDQVFQRQSVDTNRSSVDVEKGTGSPIPMAEFGKGGPSASNLNDGPIPVVAPHSSAGTSAPDMYRNSIIGPGGATSPSSQRQAMSGFSTGRSSISRRAHMSQPSSRHPIKPHSTSSYPIEFLPEIKMPTRPVLDPKSGRQIRNYTRHPGANIFCFNGRMLTGGDSPLPFIGTLIFVFGLAGIWFGCVAPWWWHHISPAVPLIAAYLTLISVSSLLITVGRIVSLR